MSRRLHLIYISLFVTRSVTARAERRQREEKGGRRGKQTRKKKHCVSMPRCLGLFLSSKCSDGGRRESDNESQTPFQDSSIVLIVQTGEAREKEAESVFSEPVLKKEQPGFFPAMCWSNYIQTL